MAENEFNRLPPRADQLSWQVNRQCMLRAEIDGSIDAFFEGNNIAARVLAWAALDVLRALAERQQVVTFHAAVEDGIREQYVKGWRALLRADYTYFKHADRDPDSTIDDYRPEITAYNLMGAVSDYGSLFKTQTLRMAIYKSWFFGRFPMLLKDEYRFTFRDAIRSVPNADHPDFCKSLESARDNLRQFIANRDEVVAGLTTEVRAAFEDLS